MVKNCKGNISVGINNQPGPLSLVESFIVLFRQLSYAIKNQLGHPKTQWVGGFGCPMLVPYGIRELAPAIPLA